VAHLFAMTDTILHLGLLDDDAIALDLAALDLAALDHPGIDLAPYADLLEAMAEHLVAERAAESAAAHAGALARVIAGEFGFVGDTDSYDDPANADLIRVIDRRRGLPVSLSILYVAMARRLGWQADALNTPAHVLVRIGTDADHVIVDPFNGGAIVEPRQIAALLVQARGSGPASEHLAPMANRSVLVRLLLNQATRAEQGGDKARALTLFERITAVAPANGHGWWERARLELTQGAIGAARASLSAMLEMTREPALRAQISAALARLAGSVL